MSTSPEKPVDDSDNDPDFCPDEPGPSVRRSRLFNLSAEVSSLIESDSDSDTISQETEKRGKKLCKKRVRD